jgi:hypothetical protein
MQVRFKQIYPTETKLYLPGMICEIEDAEAQRLCTASVAAPWRSAAKPETATNKKTVERARVANK